MKNNRNWVAMNHNLLAIDLLQMLLCMCIARKCNHGKNEGKCSLDDFGGCVGFHVSKSVLRVKNDECNRILLYPTRTRNLEIFCKMVGLSARMAFMPIGPPDDGLILPFHVVSSLSCSWTWKNLEGSKITNCVSGEAAMFTREIPCTPVG